MQPFRDTFDHEGSVAGLEYAIRVAPANALDLMVECYFRFPEGHRFYDVSIDQLDATLPDTIHAFYGEPDQDGFYWVGMAVCPDKFEDAVGFAEIFLHKCQFG